MTKKEQSTLDKVEILLSDAKEDLYEGFDEVSAEYSPDEATLPKKAIRKALKKVDKVTQKLVALLDD